MDTVPGIVSFDPQAGVLRVSGEEDRVTSGRRRRALSSALHATRDVIVDLSELTFADSSLMVDLAVLARRLRLQGRNLRLAGPQPQIQRLIEMVGLHRLPAVQVA
jgi:anti-anti-sigma factor